MTLNRGYPLQIEKANITWEQKIYTPFILWIRIPEEVCQRE